MMRTILISLCCFVLLASCNEQKKDVKETVFAPQVKALEQARAVEKTLQQGADKEREAIESSERSGEPEPK